MRRNIKIWIFTLVVIGAFLMLADSCKKSDDTPGETGSGIVKDIDGNIYNTVTIGTQVWMVENLKTTKYRDGSPIPNVTDNTQWINLKTGAYCNYNNDVTTGAKYGKLYNWYAVNDSRNIAPQGWHVATEAEWATLYQNSDGVKSLASKTDWASSTTHAAIGNDLTKNNSSGFTALPGGHRLEGFYRNIGEGSLWWTSSEFYGDLAWYRYLEFDYAYYYSNSIYSSSKGSGFSVRCLRD